MSIPPPGFEEPAANTSPAPADEAPASHAGRAGGFARSFAEAPFPRKVAILAVPLVICAASAAILLGGSDDGAAGGTSPDATGIVNDGSGGPATEPAPTAPETPDVVDTGATTAATSAQTAIETYATGNGGSYEGADAAALRAIDGTLPASLQVGSATATGYTISVSGGGDGVTYSIQRSTSGAVSYTCTPVDTGACPSDGRWLGS